MIANELAQHAGVEEKIVRYYARIGLLTPIHNPESGYREYTIEDADCVRFIRKAKWLGLTVKDIQVILSEADAGKSPCEEVRRIIINRILENQQLLTYLQALQERMETAISSWASIFNAPPHLEHVCDLIDSLECREEQLDLYAGHKFFEFGKHDKKSGAPK